MGSRGPTSKGEGRQRRNAPATVVEIRPGAPAPADVPAPPPGLLADSRRQWAAFWHSDVARAAVEVDLPALSRLFELLDERARCFRALRKLRLVDGSAGQPVMNPLAGYVAQLGKEISALEDRFGLTPMARARLGISFGQAKLTAEQLNRLALGAERSEPVDEDEAELLAEFDQGPEDPA